VTRLLITGAAGNMGRLLRPLLRRDDRVLRLTDLAEVNDLAAGEESMVADVTDPAAIDKACQDVDTILHLGGLSTEAAFDDILNVNIAGTHNVLRAAVDAGVSRVILASSNHAVGFYRRSTDAAAGGGLLPDDLPPRPDTYYGWSKAAAEAMGALYHHRYGLDVIAVRIGTCFAEPIGSRGLSTWLSDNTRRWFSLEGAQALGFVSGDDAERFAPTRIQEFGEPDPTDPVHDLVGGQFCQTPLGEPMR
jgi:uronate dehydrogenase